MTVRIGKGSSLDAVEVPRHVTMRLTTPEGWVVTRVRTGCVRVQRGDFCAYFTADDAADVAWFIRDTDPESQP